MVKWYSSEDRHTHEFMKLFAVALAIEHIYILNISEVCNVTCGSFELAV